MGVTCGAGNDILSVHMMGHFVTQLFVFFVIFVHNCLALINFWIFCHGAVSLFSSYKYSVSMLLASLLYRAPLGTSKEKKYISVRTT